MSLTSNFLAEWLSDSLVAQIFGRRMKLPGNDTTKSDQEVKLIPSSKQGISGFFAGLVSSVATYPLDLLKTRFQSSHYNHYQSIFEGFKHVVSRYGIRGLYGGIHASLIGSSLSWGAYFYIYSEFKDYFRESRQNNTNNSNSYLLPKQHFIASFAAGALTQIVSNPIWVIKTNSQLNQTRMLNL